MTAFQFKLPATALAVLLCSTAAQAQVTAQQVWDNWKAQMGAYGENGVTIGSEVLDGGVLTVSDMAMNMSDDTGSVTLTIPTMTFTENGDGTVTVGMPEVIPAAVTGTDAATGTSTAMTIEISNAGLSLVASGTPEAMNYAVAAQRYAVSVTDIVVDGTATDAAVVVGINDLAGNYSTTGTTDPMGLTYALTAGSMDLLADFTEEGVAFSMSGKAEGLAMNMTGTVPMAGMVSPELMFASGFALSGDYTLGPANYAVKVTESGMTTDVAVAMAGAAFGLAMDGSAFGFDSTVTGLNVNVTSPMMPFPIAASLGEYGLGMTMPMQPTDAPAPFGLRVALVDLAVDENIWSMIDPGQILPRDPATAVVDVTGTATMAFNLFDPAAQEQMAMTGAAPGQVDTIDLNELILRIAGAEVLASGALTLDNTDLTTIPGMPKPTGTIDVAINGANGLMDKLVQMGLIPEDQVMMGRMMLGMFAVPVGDDQLTSKIEFTADGGILANGQRIQ